MTATPDSPVDRLRRNLGDTGTLSGEPPDYVYAFSDAELATILAESLDDEDTALRQGLWELLAQGARWNDYTTEANSEKKSQVFAQLQQLYANVNDRITGAAASAAGTAEGVPARTVSVRKAWVF